MIRSSRCGHESAIPPSNGSSDSPALSSSSPALDLRVEHDPIVITRDDRVYRIRGLEQNTSPPPLNVRVLVSRDDLVYLDTIDLTKARARNQFIRATASELYRDEDLIKKDVGRILLALETLQAERIEAAKRTRSWEAGVSSREVSGFAFFAACGTQVTPCRQELSDSDSH